MSIFITKIAILIAIVSNIFPVESHLNAQSLIIPNVIVPENATHVDVPIYINVPDSAVAIQFSIVWSELELQLDSVSFSPVIQNGNFMNVTSRPADGEIRVLVLPAQGHLDIFPFNQDSAAFVLSFQLMSDFKGSADVRFNPDFPAAFSDFYANHIPATTSNGNISSPDGLTSSQSIDPSITSIRIYPNPVLNNLRIKGLPNDYLQSEVSIIDKLGRNLWSSKLTSETISVPETLPNGQYWLVINLKEGTCAKPIILQR